MPNKQKDLMPEFLPLSMARMLWKKRWIVLGAWVVLLAVAAVVVYKLPAVYLAEATVLVDSQKIPDRYVSSTVNSDVGDRLATINQEIMSTDRLLKIINTFDLYKEDRKSLTQEEIIEQMRKDISINLIKGWSGGRPGAFRVGYQGPSATVVASVANQLANLYVEENLKTRETQAEGTADFIDSQVDQAKKKLDDLERQVSEFKSAHTGSLPEQENSLLAMANSVQVQLKGVQDGINRAQQNKTMLETALSSAEATEALLVRAAQQRAGQTAAFGSGSYAPGLTPTVRKRSEVLEDALAQLRLRYSDLYPEVKALKAELERVKKREADEAAKSDAAKVDASTTDAAKPGPTKAQTAAVDPNKADTSKPVTTKADTAKAPAAPSDNKKPAAPVATAAAGPVMTPAAPAKPEVVTREVLDARERIAAIKTALNNANNDLKFQASEQDRLLKLVASYQARIDRLPMVEQQMASLTRDYENSKANYKSLLDKKLAAGMATDMERRQEAERFTIIDPARVPEKPAKPNRPLLGGVGAALAIAIGLLIGFMLEFRKNAILGEWELPPDVVVLGRIPPIKMPVDAAGNRKAAVAAVLAILAVGTAVLRQRWF